jgi:hypothetical protein
VVKGEKMGCHKNSETIVHGETPQATGTHYTQASADSQD